MIWGFGGFKCLEVKGSGISDQETQLQSYALISGANTMIFPAVGVVS